MKNKKLILIGASTGGPGHLEKILSSLDKHFSSTVIIAQHLDSIFLQSMVKHFNDITQTDVIQAQENIPIHHPSTVFAYKNLTDLHFHPSKGLILRKCTQPSHYQPSINSLFHSTAKLHAHYDILACLLTGIGDDGAEGMLALKNSGARCICESEASCIVYGMPKVASEISACTAVLSLDEIIQEIKNF